MRFFFDVDARRAVDLGFRARPFAETIDAIVQWADVDRMRKEPRHGLSTSRENELLAALVR
ncbi:hypothetical protein C5C66_00855 [Rathayibacter toxicus]|nr:hypothetical protein [Rathayibacter toxicus]PPG24841.1 hypothetical protein C5D15_00845 [Rathayibacter toxicus]PPG48296.1 hypothetical protein C5D16_00860 [Rathayibacter toxicus]PPH59292.1 hypothetical protein C5D30_00815 [Rathayibacter toxicus]PPH65411.1 hypothetical protein C5D13_00865 [Rathayibacter toxicus]PPH69574.1 hypothetical protein C5D01_00860 [Rathayibacter toxicus]